MGLRWGPTSFKCRIAVNIVPFLLSVIFIRIRTLIAKRFSGGFVTCNSSLCGTGLIADGKSGHFTVCLDFGVGPRHVLNKITIGRVVVWFSPSHGNGERHLQWRIYPSCEKPHTGYTTDMRGPTSILVTHFTPKIKLITFLNKQS